MRLAVRERSVEVDLGCWLEVLICLRHDLGPAILSVDLIGKGSSPPNKILKSLQAVADFDQSTKPTQTALEGQESQGTA